MPERKAVYVLSSRYADNSGFAVLRVFTSEERAKEDMAMIEHTGPAMHPEVTAVPLIEES